MKRISHTFAAACVAIVSALTFSSCSLINDDSDCVDSFNVFEFSYDRNLKFADAFTSEVKAVTLLGFDTNGVLAYARRASRSEMGPDGKSLEVRLEPGTYDFLVWAGEYDDDFTIARPVIGKSLLEDFTCLLNTSASHNDSPDAPVACGHCDRPLESLFHALVRLELPYASPSSPARQTINLTKNTNTIRVMLQQQNAESTLSADDFIFEITDRNAHLNHDNSLHPDQDQGNVIYHPCYPVTEGATDYISTRADDGGDATGKLNVVLAEFITGRLHRDYSTTLTVRRRSDGKTIFRIPLQKYALMIRSHYFRNMDEQEYLDRQDEYSLTFILDENQKWIQVIIEVLGWRVVENNLAAS